jgi:hypothetical protein
MTLPVPDRTCHRCEFHGDEQLFWRRDASGNYIKSPHKTVHVSWLRYGREEAQKHAYYPNKEFCPRCGYDCESYDKAVEESYYARNRARDLARAERMSRPGCLLLVFAILSFGGAAAWMLH